jgi:hypothetical protein
MCAAASHCGKRFGANRQAKMLAALTRSRAVERGFHSPRTAYRDTGLPIVIYLVVDRATGYGIPNLSLRLLMGS